MELNREFGIIMFSTLVFLVLSMIYMNSVNPVNSAISVNPVNPSLPEGYRRSQYKKVSVVLQHNTTLNLHQIELIHSELYFNIQYVNETSDPAKPFGYHIRRGWFAPPWEGVHAVYTNMDRNMDYMDFCSVYTSRLYPQNNLFVKYWQLNCFAMRYSDYEPLLDLRGGGEFTDEPHFIDITLIWNELLI